MGFAQLQMALMQREMLEYFNIRCASSWLVPANLMVRCADSLKPTPESIEEVMHSPQLIAGFDDPEVMAAVNDIAANPQAMHKYKSNAKVLPHMHSSFPHESPHTPVHRLCQGQDSPASPVAANCSPGTAVGGPSKLYGSFVLLHTFIGAAPGNICRKLPFQRSKCAIS